MKRLKLISFTLFLLSFNLSAAGYSDGIRDCKLPDEIGNLFKTEEKTDRKYGKAGQLLKDETYTYSYDEVGNLIEKESVAGTWKYRWSENGILKQVVRPDNRKVDFTYDALGRRLTKTYQNQTTHFVWDGNVPLHEWTSSIDETITSVNENGEAEISIPENLTTWIFEDGTFVPMAKLEGDKSYSIITDHLGTPTEAFDEEGQKVWSRELGIYGQTRKESGKDNFIPYLYQGQYLDVETELAYNRYRYYSPESGTYVSQDSIGLIGNNPTLYAYVKDSNSWVDQFGLAPIASWNEFQSSTKGVFESRARAAEGWKQYQNTAYGTKPIAMGRLDDTAIAKTKGFQILDSDYWSPQVNDAWVQGGIDADKDFHLVSENIEANRASSNPKYPRTIFDRELNMLEKNGYEQKGSKMKKIKC